MSDVERRTEVAKRLAVTRRNYRRVRDRALRRLANLYPDQYQQLLQEERERDEQEGKVWLDITGRTNAGVGLSTDNREPDKTTNGLGNQSEARDLG